MSIKGALILIPSKIQEMLKDYLTDIEEAWVNCGEEPLTISFSAKIGIHKGRNICEVSISFTKERIKDTTTFYWDPNQKELFKPKDEWNIKEEMDKNLKEEELQWRLPVEENP